MRPGLALASATNSAMFFAATPGFTTMSSGTCATLATATRSFCGSNGIFA